MSAQCTQSTIGSQEFFSRKVAVRLDGGRLTCDGGGLLLRETERRISLFPRLAACLTDYRCPDRTEHRVEELLRQRIYGLALGCEDLNDHDELRCDSLPALLCGKADIRGGSRPRERDRGQPLAGSSTLSRLELGRPEQARQDRYRKIAADPEAMDRLLADLLMEAHAAPPAEIWLDADAADDPVHGNQELRFYHGCCREYCCLPLYIFCGERLLRAPTAACAAMRFCHGARRAGCTV